MDKGKIIGLLCALHFALESAKENYDNKAELELAEFLLNQALDEVKR